MDVFLKVLCGIIFVLGAFIVNNKMREQNARRHLEMHEYEVCSEDAT